MMFLEWRESMEVGVPPVDRDHRLLVSLINQLHDNLSVAEERGIVGTVLAALTEYTAHHFRREERVMEACGFPGLDDHRCQHWEIAAKVMDIEERYRHGNDEILSDSLLAFLKDWLTEHILKSDHEITPFVNGNAAAIQAAEEVPRLSFGDDEVRLRTMDWSGLKVLIVDDNPNFRRIITTILETVNVGRVADVGTVDAALLQLDRMKPDLIISDVLLDGIDGLEFVTALRESGNETPVVMVSGFDIEHQRHRAGKAHISSFLEKPLMARQLLAAMADCLK